MKRKGRAKLGMVLHFVDNKLIAKGERLEVAKIINSIVIDEKKREIGRVYDVFGPVKRPYIGIRPVRSLKEKELKKLTNTKIFTR
jgi:rRNA processing protein Gar1